MTNQGISTGLVREQVNIFNNSYLNHYDKDMYNKLKEKGLMFELLHYTKTFIKFNNI